MAATSRLGSLGWFAAGLGPTLGMLWLNPPPTAECKGRVRYKSIEVSKVKRKKRVQTGSECAGLMLTLLACYKSYNFSRGKCETEEKALTECTIRVAAKPQAKDTMRYHIARIIRQMK